MFRAIVPIFLFLLSSASGVSISCNNLNARILLEKSEIIVPIAVSSTIPDCGDSRTVPQLEIGMSKESIGFLLTYPFVANQIETRSIKLELGFFVADDGSKLPLPEANFKDLMRGVECRIVVAGPDPNGDIGLLVATVIGRDGDENLATFETIVNVNVVQCQILSVSPVVFK